jgi:hypothetical protein
MRPGITIQHASLPERRSDLVRCDIAAVIGFVPRAWWPEEAVEGDLVEVQLRRAGALEDDPRRELFDAVTRDAARQFFENGGSLLHLVGVCVADLGALRAPTGDDGLLVPLFQWLRNQEDLGLIAVPSAATWRCEVSRTGGVTSHADTLWDELLAHCRQAGNRFLVIDAPRGLHGELLERWVGALRDREPLSRSYGAVYYPWLVRGDRVEPPSGAVMGLVARLENERAPYGVGVPPANLPVLGFTHAEVELDWGEVGRLNDANINSFISQPGRGVVVWGARTLSRDPAWQFVNSRRVVGLVTEQLRRDNEWAVFEPNDRSLWKVLERDVNVRLQEFWEAGLISGGRSAPEFSVDCSENTNLPATRDSGIVNVEVTLRPVGTTERILIDLRIGSGTL